MLRLKEGGSLTASLKGNSIPVAKLARVVDGSDDRRPLPCLIDRIAVVKYFKLASHRYPSFHARHPTTELTLSDYWRLKSIGTGASVRPAGLGPLLL